jgi:hypothetical protein
VTGVFGKKNHRFFSHEFSMLIAAAPVLAIARAMLPAQKKPVLEESFESGKLERKHHRYGAGWSFTEFGFGA